MPDTATVTSKIILDIAEVTEIGGRQSNQDALAVARHNELACFVVSDGVGGENGGEIASQTVVESVIRSFAQQPVFHPRHLQSYVEHASLQLAQRKSEGEKLDGMSATVAVVLVDQSSGATLWAHMGDTRIYLFRGDAIQRATKDHSLVQQLVDAGYCRADQLRWHPHRSTLWAALGSDGSVEVTETPIMLEPGDAILVCSDGFWEWVIEQEMEQARASASSAKEWLANMLAAVERRSRLCTSPADNYTAFAICVSDAK